MADAAALEERDVVLEIGPGTGMLTRTLLDRGARIVAVEADVRAVTELEATFKDACANGALTLHHGDIREFTPACAKRSTPGRPEDLHVPCGKYKVIANIPYHLSGILFRQFLSSDCQPETLVFLVQKEVAERIVPKQFSPRAACARRSTAGRAVGKTAEGGSGRNPKESLLSLSVKAYGRPTYVRTVARGNFNPRPRVDSAIVSVTDISKRNFRDTSEPLFFEILRLGFGSRRKQLLGNLSKRYDRAALVKTFSTLDIRTDVRAEDVPLGTWLKLVQSLSVHS